MATVDVLPVLVEEFGLINPQVLDALVSYPTREVLHVVTAAGEFAVKIDGDPLGPSPGGVDALAFLRQAGFRHCPRLRKTRNDDLYAWAGSATVVVLDWVPEPAVPTEATWSALGEASARLHDIIGYRKPFAVDFSRAVRDLAARAHGLPFATEYLHLLTQVRLEVLTGSTLVHGEINESNVRLARSGVAVLVDWDQAGRAHPSVDYGYPLIVRFVNLGTHDIDEALASAYYRSYRAAGGAIDRDAAMNAALFHALRYLWFADTDARWERVKWAAANRARLLELLD